TDRSRSDPQGDPGGAARGDVPRNRDETENCEEIDPRPFHAPGAAQADAGNCQPPAEARAHSPSVPAFAVDVQFDGGRAGEAGAVGIAVEEERGETRERPEGEEDVEDRDPGHHGVDAVDGEEESGCGPEDDVAE